MGSLDSPSAISKYMTHKIGFISVLLLSFIFVSCENFQSDRPKTIKYKNVDYYAIGATCKKSFVEGQVVSFFSNETKDTIISGKFFVKDNIPYLEGVYRSNDKELITRTYGVFEVKNDISGTYLSADKKRCYKISIEPKDVTKYHGYIDKNPTDLVKVSNMEYLLTMCVSDENGNNSLSKHETVVESSLVSKYGYHALKELLIKSTQNVRRTFSDGKVFHGNVENHLENDGTISSIHKEGELSFTHGLIMKMTIKRFDENSFICTLTYSLNENNTFTSEEFFIDNQIVEKYDYWDFGHFMPEIRKLTYKNRNVFIGKVEYTIDENNGEWTTFALRNGILQYSSGEIFTGDIDGEWFCGMPVSGKILFNDNIELTGNWLAKYHLSQDEADEISKTDSPTEKRNKAEQIYYQIMEHPNFNSSKNRSFYNANYFDEQFLYYVFNSDLSSFENIKQTHYYDNYTIKYGLFFDETATIDNSLYSYFSWNIGDVSANAALRGAKRIINNGELGKPKDIFARQNYTNDYLRFLRICENFIRTDLKKHYKDDDYENCLCAKLFRQKLFTMVSRDDYERNYNYDVSYNIFLEYGAVAMVNDFLIKISRERDRLGDSDYVFDD